MITVACRNPSSFRFHVVSLLRGALLALAAVSCGDDAPKDPRDAAVDDGGTPKQRGDIDGHVFRADTLAPVEGATITGPNGITARSDAQGKFRLSMLQSERTALVANADTFAQAIEPVTVTAGKTASVEFRLLSVSASVELDSSKGGEVRSATGAAVVIDEGAFVDSEGKPVSGMVTVELTVLDPSTPAGMQAFPGDFAATSRSGNVGQLESFVPMEITARSGDKVLDFAADKAAEVSFPVPGGLKDKAPQTIALWSLSEATGAWTEEGTATLVTDSSGQLVYRGKLTHMSWWNCDRFIDRVTCIRGCVTRDGAAASSVLTQAEGIDYSNLGQAMTKSDGCFAEDVKAGAQLRVRAITADATSEWKVITAPEALMNSRNDRSKCLDVGTLELIARKSEDMGCPAGTTKCGDRCVDLATDYDNCGSCRESCFGGLVGASCIAGACACKASETQCDSGGAGPRCTNLDFDEANCGKCGQRCALGQACEAGECKQLACAEGLALCGSACVETATNGRHCGACDAICPMGQSCNAGKCEVLSCPATQELCGNMCVAKGTCRGMLDCTAKWACTPTKDAAPTSISVCKVCDGQMDCAGGDDEAPKLNDGPCTTCPNGAIARGCDGVKDCAGGEDEMGCSGASIGGGRTTPPPAGGAGAGGAGAGGAGSGSAGTGGQTGGNAGAKPDSGIGGTGGAGSGAAGDTAAGSGGTTGNPDPGAGGGSSQAGTSGGAGNIGAAGGGAGVGAAGGGGVGGVPSAGGAGAAGSGAPGGAGGAGAAGGGAGVGAAGGGAGVGAAGGGAGVGGEPSPGGAGGAAGGGGEAGRGVPGGAGGAGAAGGGGAGGSGPSCTDGFLCPVEQQCISKQLLCNTEDDCSDGADEQKCASLPCPEGQVMCPGGGCAPSAGECGGGQSCGPNQVQCSASGDSTICATRCDQNIECQNGADEEARECCDRAGGVYCNTGSAMECVTKDHVCANDGDQCVGGADEDPADCCKVSDGMLCQGAQGEICVPKSQVCAADGAQCVDGKDEDPARCCEQDHGFFCRTSQQCIEYAKTCDSASDCADGSDENAATCGCPSAGDQACDDGKQCIASDKFCDGGTPDCTDGSDENGKRCGCPQGQILCQDNKSCAQSPQQCPGIP